MRIWTHLGGLAVLGLGLISTLPAQALDLSKPLPKVAAEELLPGA